MKSKLFVTVLIAACCLCGLAFAAKKIIYFTGDAVPTSDEKSTITTLSNQAVAPYTVVVRNGMKARQRAKPESADYLAGAIPPNYRDGGVDSGTALYTVYSVINPPTPSTLVSTQAVVRSGDVLHIVGGGSATVSIVGNTINITTHVNPDGGT
jgi:hypothetical protein